MNAEQNISRDIPDEITWEKKDNQLFLRWLFPKGGASPKQLVLTLKEKDNIAYNDKEAEQFKKDFGLSKDGNVTKEFQTAIKTDVDGDFKVKSFLSLYKYITTESEINLKNKIISLKKKEGPVLQATRPPASLGIYFAKGKVNDLKYSEGFQPGEQEKKRIQDQLRKKMEGGDFTDKDELLVILREDGSIAQVGFKNKELPVPIPILSNFARILLGFSLATIILFVLISVEPRIKRIVKLGNGSDGVKTINLQEFKNYFLKEFETIKSRLPESWLEQRIQDQIKTISTTVQGNIQGIKKEQEKFAQLFSQYQENDNKYKDQQTNEFLSLKGNVDDLLSRIPKPKAVDASQKQKQDAVLLFGRNFGEWLRNLRENHDNLFKNDEFSKYLMNFWKNFNNSNLVNLLYHLEIVKEGLKIEEDFNLDLVFNKVLYNCLGPAIILMNHFVMYEERTGNNMGREIYHIVRNLNDLINTAITTIERPPIGIAPVEIKIFSKFYDPHQIMHPIKGDRDSLIKNSEKRHQIDEYSDYILDVESWAFERNGELLDGRKAKVVIG